VLVGAILGRFFSGCLMRVMRFVFLLTIGWMVAAAQGQSATSTTLAITSGGNPVSQVQQGTEVTLTATVTSGGAAAAAPGQVEFCEVQPTPLKCTDIRLLGTMQLNSAGTASYRFYPGPGTHTYQAKFLGTHLEAASESLSTVLTVTPFYTTTTALSGSAASSSGYTLTATVTGSQGSAPPTGTVTFEDASNGNYVLGTATLVPESSSGAGGFSFATSQVLTTQEDCLTAAVVDLNGDGKPDVVLGVAAYVSNGVYTNTVEVYLGNGDGTFTHMPSIPTSLNTIALGVGDFNGDGKPDVAVFGVRLGNGEGYIAPGYPGNQVQVLLGNGDGTFTVGQAISNPDPNQPYPALNPPTNPPSPNYANPTIAVGDFNGDGIADLAMTTGVNETVAIFFGNGDGTFRAGPATFAGFDPDGIAVGDFNGDGKADVAVTSLPATYGGTSSVTILLGNGDGSFTAAPSIVNVGNTAAAIVTGDFNGDGIPDLATESLGGLPNNGVSVFLGNGDGTFTAAPGSPIPGTAASGSVLALGDLNGDGKADLVTSPGGELLSLLLGNGDGTFQAAIGAEMAYSMVYAPSAVALGDFTGSGLAGIVSANYNAYDAYVLLSQTTPQISKATLSGVSIVGSGQHEIVAVYSGSSSYQGSTSPPLLMDATPQPTTVAVTVNPPSSTYGQPVVLTATIVPGTAQNHAPTGTVTFEAGGSVAGTGNVLNGVATLQTTLLPVGTDDIIAYYSGDENFASSAGYGSAVVSGFSSVTVLSSAPNPSYAGEAVSLTASVSGVGSTVIPAGVVTFYDSATVIGQGTLNASGHATFTTSSLSLGQHSLSAVYAATAGYYGSTSAAVIQVVALAVSATTLTAGPNPAAPGQTVTMTATVAGSGSATAGAGTPTGAVTFFDGTTQIGSAAVNSAGQASYSTLGLALGTHMLTAVYAGTASYAGSISNVVTEVIEVQGFTMALSSPSITLATYQHTTTTVTLTSLGDYADNITISCASPPAYVTCLFKPTPASLTGNGTAAVSFYLDTDSIVGGASGPLQGSRREPGSLIAFALLLPWLGGFAVRSRRGRRSLFLVLAAVSVASLGLALGGCGSNVITPVASTAPGTYTIAVVATGDTTGVTHTAQLTLTVTAAVSGD
jgi:hypothetical protein